MTGHRWKKTNDLKGNPSVRYTGWVCVRCGCLTYTSALSEKLKPSKGKAVDYRLGGASLTCDERIAQQVIEE
jgi:hypothetical protein